MLDLSKVWPEWKAIEKIGEGSFGKVYKCERDEYGIKSVCAIKVISIPQSQAEIESMSFEGLSEDGARTYFSDVVNDFANEIKLMEMLKGAPNVVSVENYKIVERENEIGWDIYIRMEYLQSFVSYSKNKRFTETDVKAFALDISNALDICSKSGVIHRDVKPDNIFVDKFGSFKLGDFGVARRLEGSMSMMSKKGTYSYMAPEVFRGEKYDCRADIYSLGMVMYKLLNRNRDPFVDLNKPVIGFKERNEAIERRRNGERLPAPVDASASLANVILKACAFKVEDRYASVEEFRAAILGANEAETTEEPTVAARDFETRAAMLKSETAVKNNFEFMNPNVSEQATQAACFGEEPTVFAYDEPTVFDNGDEETIIGCDEPTVVFGDYEATVMMPENRETEKSKTSKKVKVKEKTAESIDKALVLVRNIKIYKWSVFALAIAVALIAAASFRSPSYFLGIHETYSNAEALLWWNGWEGTIWIHDELYITGIIYNVALIVWFIMVVKNKPVFSTIALLLTAGCYGLNSYNVYDARYHSGKIEEYLFWSWGTERYQSKDIGYELFYNISYDCDYVVFWVLMALAFVIQMTVLITWAVEMKKGNRINGYTVSIPQRISKYLAGIMLITAVALVVLFTLLFY